jgi:hypothetical protein
MAEKKAVLIVAGKASIKAGSNIETLAKKGVFIPYAAGDIVSVAAKVEGVAKVASSAVAAELEKGTALALVDLGAGDDAALDAALGPILEAADRRTLIVAAGADKLALYGQGVAKGAEIKHSAVAADVIPTICFVADVFLPAGIEYGAVLYAALKDPNARLKEIGKLQESIRSMQAAMERDSREPWDKHDCA